MSDLTLEQAIAEMRDLVRCRCHPGFKDRGLHDPDCDCDSAEAVEVLIRALPAVQPDAAAIREAALLEAAEICRNYSMDDGSGMFDVHSAACEHSILALIDKPAHVNETPKSEHVSSVMLTPAKGDA